MSAETLRRAAALMRERAADAGAHYPSPWTEVPSGSGHGVDSAREGVSRVCTSPWSFSASHIASWHPAVALAVADWLEEEAATWDFNGWPQSDNAFTVARAYLSESA